jgi:hypothetical protein
MHLANHVNITFFEYINSLNMLIDLINKSEQSPYYPQPFFFIWRMSIGNK